MGEGEDPFPRLTAKTPLGEGVAGKEFFAFLDCYRNIRRV